MNFLPDVEVVCPVCHGRRYQKEVLGVKYNGLSISDLFDEPTVGLHPQDVERLIGVFDRLVMKGNSVVVIEHNQSVLRAADWLIDLGPEGGKRGGCIMAQGKPEEII